MPENPTRKERFFEKLKDKYRLVILSEESFEEVFSFKLSRTGVYVLLCSFFVILMIITVGLMVFTPLKYYIPGYGDIRQRQEYIQINVKVDSLEKVIDMREKYLHNLKQVLSGDFEKPLDTARLKVPDVGNSTY